MLSMEAIRKLFKDSSIQQIESNDYDAPIIRLVESNTSDSSVLLKKVPNECVVVKLDASFKNEEIFSGKHGECSRCDYIIFFIKEKCLNILYIELKKTDDQSKKIMNQLKGGSVFVKYCEEIVRTFFQEQYLMASHYKEHFVAFGHTGRATKKPTSCERERGNNGAPERFRKITFPSPKGVQFAAMLAK